MVNHSYKDMFNRMVCDITRIINTPVGSTALRNKITEIFYHLMDTNYFTPTINDDVQGIRVFHSLNSMFIKILYTIKEDRVAIAHTPIRQLLVDEIKQLHIANLKNYCEIYNQNIDTVTATDLARAMTRSVVISFRTTTKSKAKHFGIAFIHLGLIKRNGNLGKCIMYDLSKSAHIYTAKDLFNYLISIGRG